MIKNTERVKLIQKMVDIQAEDDGLWCITNNPYEAYLQYRLRQLHMVVESNNLDEIKKIIEGYDD
jgi:hypothetical protein